MGGDYQSLQCLGWERGPSGSDATSWFPTSGENQGCSPIGPVAGRRGPPPHRGSQCVGCSDLFTANSSAPRRICSPGRPGSNAAPVHFGLCGRFCRRVAGTQRNKAKHFFLSFAKNFCHISYFSFFPLLFCLCDAVPSVFLEGDTISGFKSA